MPAVGRKASGNHTQSVVFFKAAGWTEANSRAWCKSHGYRTDGHDENETQHRWRQYDMDPNQFRYRNEVIAKKGSQNSIMLVLGYPAGSQSAPENGEAFECPKCGFIGNAEVNWTAFGGCPICGGKRSYKLARYRVTEDVGRVDREQGIIYGVSLVTKGEAKGHGEYVDDTAVQQVVDMAQGKEPLGLKSRFDHPQACSRSMGTVIGRFHNARRDGDHGRADLHLLETAASSPDGDLRGYVMDLAEEDPKAFATSIIFRHSDPEQPDRSNEGKEGYPATGDAYWLPHIRLESLSHCDVVDEGAANDGIFGRADYWEEQAERWADEHPGVIGSMLDRYFRRKREREENKMGDLAELQDKLTALQGKNTELQEAIDKHDAEMKDAVATAKAEGAKEALASVKDRMMRYKDAGFVLEHLDKTDEEIKDAYIAKLEGDRDKMSGPPPADHDGDQGGALPPDETFSAKVKEFEEDGKMSHGKAVQAAARKFPKLHRAWIREQNKRD